MNQSPEEPTQPVNQPQESTQPPKKAEPKPSLLFVWLGGPLVLLLISGALSYVASFVTGGDTTVGIVVSILTLVPAIYVVWRMAVDRGGSAITVITVVFAAFIYSILFYLVILLIFLSLVSSLGVS